ncbi:MAG: caspase family protein [Planctomycetes bacterium]|nr:caspase family protein [Planctomycetota bacterium]
MADDARSGAGDRRWQNQAGPAAGPARGMSRRFWLTLLAGLFLVFLTVLVVWILAIRPPPPPPFYLNISIGETNSRKYPVIGFTRQDYERIRRHFPQGTLAETKTKELLQKELKGLSDKADPIIIHITALALARQEKVFLLPGDASPDDQATWLDVGDVLSAVAACPAKNKLLILDLAHPIADPRLGALADRVAETLEKQITDAKPSFFVLLPCSAGQISWRSEALQSSVLAYYLDQGLLGNANTDKDPHVKLRELVAFLEARVDRRVQTTHAARQKPRLFGDAEDFVMVSPPNDPLEEIKPGDLAPFPAVLQKTWRERDAWWAKGAYRRAPRFLRQLEANLLRQESQWRGGILHEKDLEAHADDLQLPRNDLARALNVPRVPRRSVALALKQSLKAADASLGDAALNILANTKSVDPKKKELNAKVEEELIKKLKEPKGIELPQQMSAILEALERMPRLSADHFRVARAVARKLSPDASYVELIYLDRLIAFADRKGDDAWHEKKILTLLQTMRMREAAVAGLDSEPELLPWLHGAIEEADSLRVASEKKLLWEGMSTWDDAFARLQTAKGKYKDVLFAFEILQRSRVQLDLAFADLPAHRDLLCDASGLDVLAEQAWTRASQEAETLQTYFASPPMRDKKQADQGKATLDLDTPARELERHLRFLAKSIERQIDLAAKDDTAESVQRRLLLLDSTLLTAAQHATLFARHRAVAAKLNEATDELDNDDNKKGVVTPLPPAVRRDQPATRGLMRARMSWALLRLAGTKAGKEKPSLPPATGRMDTLAWAELERRMQKAWSRDLVDPGKEKLTPFRADAFNRLVSPWELERFEKDPSVVVQTRYRDAFRAWLHERYRAQATFLEGGRDTSLHAFYADAARELNAR